MKSITCINCVNNKVESIDKQYNINHIGYELFDYGIVYNYEIYNISESLCRTKYHKFKTFAISLLLG